MGRPACFQSSPGAPRCPQVLGLGGSHVSHGFRGTVPVTPRILRGAIHPSGLWGRRGSLRCFPAAPRAREPASEPAQEHGWAVQCAPLVPRVALEGRIRQGSEQVCLAAMPPTRNSEGRLLPKWSGSVPRGLAPFQLWVKGGEPKFIGHHPQPSGVCGPHQAWISPQYPRCFEFPTQQAAAPQVSLTKATPQVAPETGEKVLHRRGRKVAGSFGPPGSEESESAAPRQLREQQVSGEADEGLRHSPACRVSPLI